MQEVFKCPKCNSTQTRFRIKTDDRFCYACGNCWKLKLEEEKLEEDTDGIL